MPYKEMIYLQGVHEGYVLCIFSNDICNYMLNSLFNFLNIFQPFSLFINKRPERYCLGMKYFECWSFKANFFGSPS